MLSIRTRATTLSLTTALVVLIAVLPAIASEDAQPTAERSLVEAVSHGEWTTWEWADPLTNRTTKTIDGKPYKDGCTYDFSGVAVVEPPTGHVYMDRAVAENLSTCQLTLESGSIEREKVADLLADVDLPGIGSGGGMAQAASSSKTAWVKHGYEDPPGLDVNWTKANVSWSYDGNCVNNSWNHTGSSYHLWVTGWTRDYINWNQFTNCSYARTQVNAQFHNSGFCFSQPTTYTKYHSTRIYGYWNGTYGYNNTSSKWGGCTNLLSPFTLYGSS